MITLFFNNLSTKNYQTNINTKTLFSGFFLISQLLAFNIEAKAQNPNNNIYQAPQAINQPSPIAPKPNYAPIPAVNVQNPPSPPVYNPPALAPSNPTIAPVQNQPSVANNPTPANESEIKNLPKNDYFGPKIAKPKIKKKIVKKIAPIVKNPDSKNENSVDLDPFKKPIENANQTQNNDKIIKKNMEIESKKYDINPNNYYYRDEKNANWLSYEKENISDDKFIIIDKNPVQDDFNKKYHDDLIIDNSKNQNQPIPTKTKEKVNNNQIKFGLENLNGEYVYNFYSNSRLINTNKNQIKNLLMSKIELENHFFSRLLRTNLSFSKSLNSANKSKFYQYNSSNPNNPQQITEKYLSTTSNNYKEFNFLSSIQLFQDYIRLNLGYRYNQLIFDEYNFQTISSSSIANGNFLDVITNKNPVKRNGNFNTKYKIPFVGLEIKFPIIAKITNFKISSAYSNRASIANRIIDRDLNTTQKTNFKNAKYFNLGLELENKISKNFTINLNYNFQKINLAKSKVKIIDNSKDNNGLSSKFSSFGINLGYKF